MRDIYALLGAPQRFDAEHNYVTSPWFSSTILAAIRGTIAFYTFFVLLFMLIWEDLVENDASRFFCYFTELTYTGICSYYWASFVQTFVYARRLKHATENAPEYPLQRWPRILQILHVMLSTTIVSFPILVTIVFWSLLASPAVFSTRYSSWSNISIHALNTVWSLFEMLGTNSPPPRWIMLPFMIFILALYLALAYVAHATQGFYTYSFLDPKTQHAMLAAYIVGIAVGGCIIFSLAKTLMWLRMRFARAHGRTPRARDFNDSDVEAKGESSRSELSSSPVTGEKVA